MSDQYERLMEAVDKYAALSVPYLAKVASTGEFGESETTWEPNPQAEEIFADGLAVVLLEARILEASAKMEEHRRECHTCKPPPANPWILCERGTALDTLIQQREEG
jgi:hypothetical protein